MDAPIAQKIEHVNIYHEEKINDPYHWLRQKNWTQETGVDDEKILAYLQAENDYAESFFQKNNATYNAYLDRLKAVIDVDQITFPVSRKGYGYFSKSFKRGEYPQHWVKNLKTGQETLLCDEAVLAKNHDYFNLGILSICPHHRYMAYAYDTNGSERYILKIKDMKTQVDLPYEWTNVSGNGFVWSACGENFFFQKVDDQWRSNTVHQADIATGNATLIFEEPDFLNHVGIQTTRDDQFLLINSRNAKDNMIYVHPLNQKKVNLESPFGREKNRLYALDAQDQHWIMSINDCGPHKRLLKIPFNHPLTQAQNIYEDLPIVDYTVYKDTIALLVKKEGLPALFFIKNQEQIHIPFDDKSFTLSLMNNDYHDSHCHIQISSLTKPVTDIMIHMETNDKEIVKTRDVPNFNMNDYITDRLWAKSLDGTHVPYTIAYKKGIDQKPAPTYLYGYGSYGYPLEPDFRASFIPLLEDGYVVVLAHIRGGGDLGRGWYEAAKLKTKNKTFEDFIACADDLITRCITTQGNITICGGSAGGMLVGAVINMRPELFSSAIAMVPFVDVVNTMMDESLPLTPGEFLEWGNPKEKEFYDCIKAYSPYENVTPQNYPALYVTAGLNDPRVTYWEPAKWVARLRATKLDKNILLFETEMGAGHGGPSGKSKALEEVAKRYTFMKIQKK